MFENSKEKQWIRLKRALLETMPPKKQIMRFSLEKTERCMN